MPRFVSDLAVGGHNGKTLPLYVWVNKKKTQAINLRCNRSALRSATPAEDSALRNWAEARCIIDPNPINVNEGSGADGEVELIRLDGSKIPSWETGRASGGEEEGCDGLGGRYSDV